MSVFVLGASGFLGRHITGALRDSGYEVITSSRSDCSDVVLDATDTEGLKQILAEVSAACVINLLGAGLSDPHADFEVMESVNANFPAQLVNLLAQAAPDTHLIHAASSTETPSVDGAYESEYSRTKAHGTQALEFGSNGHSTTILRVHNTYGRDQPAPRFVSSAIDSLTAGHSIDLRHPNRVRDFIHVDDVAASFVAAVGDKKTGVTTYEVGTGVGTSLSSVLRMIASIVGVAEPVTSSNTLQDLHPYTVASSELLLRPATIPLQQGLELTVMERTTRGTGS